MKSYFQSSQQRRVYLDQYRSDAIQKHRVERNQLHLETIQKMRALESQKQTSQGYNIDLSKDHGTKGLSFVGKDTNREGVRASINTTSLRDSQKIYSEHNVRASNDGKAAKARYAVDATSPSAIGLSQNTKDTN